MSGLMLLLLLLTPPQDPKQDAADVAKAKRAVIVDRIMAEPLKPALIRVPNAVVFEQQVVRRTATVQTAKRLTLELKAVAVEGEQDENRQQDPAARPMNIAELALSKDNFDRWVFDDNRSEEARKNRLYEVLSDKLHTIQLDQTIGEEQLKKLRLAGNGDIKRFLDRLDAARAEFERVRQDYNAGRLALGQLEPMATEYQSGPFGSDSLFDKTLRKFQAQKKSGSAEGK